MDRRVVLEAAVQVYDVSSRDEAVRIAVAKTGEMLNPGLSHVEIAAPPREAPGGGTRPPAFLAAGEALVALELEMVAFDTEGPKHAARVARKEVGSHLDGVPLAVETVEPAPNTEP